MNSNPKKLIKATILFFNRPQMPTSIGHCGGYPGIRACDVQGLSLRYPEVQCHEGGRATLKDEGVVSLKEKYGRPLPRQAN